jgi:2-keto-4-pentenoate hydratase
MDVYERQKAGDLLAQAYITRVPVAPPTVSHPSMSVDDAYQIQQLQVLDWTAKGRTLRGYKVGLTSLAMQQQLGVASPDFGCLLDDMVHEDGAVLPVQSFLQPRIEPELAFVLGADLDGGDVTPEQAAEAVDHVLPALEVIDSRISDWRLTIADTIADNASSGAVVLGTRPVALATLDLRLGGCNLALDGRIVATGTSGAVMGSPLRALAWLANALAEQGVGMRAGHIVLAGSMTAAVPVLPGQSWTAEFAGAGTVSARFSAADA